MPAIELIKLIKATYDRHGWELRAVLLPPVAVQELTSSGRELLGAAELREANFEALWFARASHGNREAWELRLISETPYALFEAFEADESEADRAAARLEMENRMREYARPADA